jgi:protoheme IX farnesyltransferase
MPNAKGPDRTRLEILVYSLILAPLGMVPFLTGAGGWLYGVASALMGLGLLAHAARVFVVRDGADANKRAMALFGFSILYLFTLFGLIVIEHGFGLLARWGL